MRIRFCSLAVRHLPFPILLLTLVFGGAPPVSAAGPRLLLISFDGMRPDAITEERTPNLAALRATGAQAINAFNDLPSVTMTNHVTMLTGQVADTHHITLDFELPGKLALPTLLDFAHDAGLRCAFFACKSKLSFMAHEAALETLLFSSEQDYLVDQLLPQLTPDGPDVIFLHLREPDSSGHAHGWMSEPYLQAVAWNDELIGKIRAAVAADTTRPTYWILTADHGGDGPNHFLNIEANRHIPWIVSGPDIPPGILEQPVSIADTTPTALWLLGIADLPAGLAGRVQTAVKDPSRTEALPPAPIAPIGFPCGLSFLPIFLGFGYWAWRGGTLKNARTDTRYGNR